MTADPIRFNRRIKVRHFLPQTERFLLLLIAFVGVVDSFPSISAQPIPNESQRAKPDENISGVEFKFIQEALPGTTENWAKLVCDFKTTDPWTDNVTFRYSMIVDPQIGKKSRLRNLTGEITYSNVKEGTSSAVMYLSPNATERFGTPVAARVEIVVNDLVIDSIDWLPDGNGEGYDAVTQKRAPAYRGILLSMGSTPWLIHDMERTPDLIR